MAAYKPDEKKFTEYLDRIMAGEDVSADAEPSEELRTAVEFARSLYADQVSPAPEFRERLWNRLLNKIKDRPAIVPAPEQEGFFTRLARAFSPQSPALKIAVGVAAAVLVIIVGTVWYNMGNNAARMTATMPAAMPNEYAAELPSNNVPGQLIYYLDTSLSSQEEQVQVYRVEQLGITEDYVATLGEKLEFPGKPVYIDGGLKLIMSDSEGDSARQLTAWTRTGAIEYGYTNLEKLYTPYTPNLPSPEIAKKLAYDFLKQLDLLPTGYKNLADIQDKIIVEVGGGYNITDKSTGNVVQQDASFWLVKFPFFVDGHSATGPGAKIEVSIGDKGEPVNLVWAWRQIIPAFTGKAKSEENAFSDIVNNKGSADVPASCKNVMVNGVTLSYWINPLSEKQDYVLPVYEFKGDCLDKDGRFLESFTAWVDALLPAN